MNEAAAFSGAGGDPWPNGAGCPHCGARQARLSSMACAPSPARSTRKALSAWPQEVRRLPQAVHGDASARCFEDSHVPLHKWFQAIHLLCAVPRRASARISSTAPLEVSTRPLGSWRTVSAKPCVIGSPQAADGQRRRHRRGRRDRLRPRRQPIPRDVPSFQSVNA